MSGGYIKLWRQIQESALWKDSRATHVFLALLLRASRKPRKTIVNVGRGPVVVELQPGQCLIRERLLAEDLGMTRNTLRRRLALLGQLGCVTVESPANYTIVTISKWSKYQSGHPKGGAKTEPPTGPPTGPHYKKVKKVKKVSCTEPSTDDSEPADGFPPFPVTGGTHEWILPASKLREWQEAFPCLDVTAELRKARQWVVDNRTKRKTANGMTRFLNSWLNRVQDNGRGSRASGNGNGQAQSDWKDLKP